MALSFWKSHTHPLMLRARELEIPPVAVLVAPSPGDLPRTGSLAGLSPASVRLLALKTAEDGDGVVLRAQNTGDAPMETTLTWQGQTIPLGPVNSGRIVTWRLTRNETGGWRACPTDIQERRPTAE